MIVFSGALTKSQLIRVKQFPKWDLLVVLQGLTKAPFGHIAEVSVSAVTFKGVFFIAITLTRRVIKLHALSVRVFFLSIFPDRIVLKVNPPFLPKVSLTFHRSQEIVLTSLVPDPSNRKGGVSFLRCT